MMRKDVRIGFAIGGVLLAVLIVYGLVTSGPNPRNNEVTLAPDDPVAAAAKSSSSSPKSDPTKPPGEPSGESDALSSGTASRVNGSAGAGAGALASNTTAKVPTTGPVDKWHQALETGVVPLMAKSETPSPSAPVAAGQQSGNEPTAQPSPQQADQATATNSAAPGAPGGPASTDASTPQNAADNNAAPSAAPASGSAGGGAFDARVLAGMASNGATPPANAAAASTSGANTSAAVPAGTRTHVVQPSETFASIAEMAYGSQAYYPHILRANPKVEPKKLRAGMTIVLPDKEQVIAKDLKAPNSASPGAGTGAASGTSALATPNPGAAQPAAATLPPIDERTQYRVRPSESLYKISLKLYGKADKVDAIYNLNKDAIGPDPSRLKAGTVLKLPEPPTATATAAR